MQNRLKHGYASMSLWGSFPPLVSMVKVILETFPIFLAIPSQNPIMDFSSSISACAYVCVCMCTHVHACTYMCGCAWVYCAHGDQVPRLGNHMFYIDINLSFHLPFNNCHPTRLGICCVSYFQDSWSSSWFLITTHDAIESKAVIPLKMTPLSSSLLLLL